MGNCSIQIISYSLYLCIHVPNAYVECSIHNFGVCVVLVGTWQVVQCWIGGWVSGRGYSGCPLQSQAVYPPVVALLCYWVDVCRSRVRPLVTEEPGSATLDTFYFTMGKGKNLKADQIAVITALYQAGHTNPEISTQTGIYLRTVQVWTKKFRESPDGDVPLQKKPPDRP